MCSFDRRRCCRLRCASREQEILRLVIRLIHSASDDRLLTSHQKRSEQRKASTRSQKLLADFHSALLTSSTYRRRCLSAPYSLTFREHNQILQFESYSTKLKNSATWCRDWIKEVISQANKQIYRQAFHRCASAVDVIVSRPERKWATRGLRPVVGQPPHLGRVM